MSQFRLGRAKRPREVFEPRTFGFHSHAVRETAVWVQTLTWTLEKSTSLTRSEHTAVRRFLADYYGNAGSIIIMVAKPLQLVLMGRKWRSGQSPKLRLPSSLGVVTRALQGLSERPRMGGRTSSSIDTTPLRTDLAAHKKDKKQQILYVSGVKK